MEGGGGSRAGGGRVPVEGGSASAAGAASMRRSATASGAPALRHFPPPARFGSSCSRLRSAPAQAMQAPPPRYSSLGVWGSVFFG